VALPTDLTVRDLDPDDAPAVIALVTRGHATYRDFAPPGWDPPTEDEAHWETTLRDPRRSSCGAFDGGGRLVAFIAWEQFRPRDGQETTPGVAEVTAVFVDPSRWRQGIATSLLREAEEAMRTRRYELARLWTPEEAPAKRLYERNGWHADGRRAHDRLDLPVVGYEKHLT
jgi:GNAT superfamily N-acetyltransferase